MQARVIRELSKVEVLRHWLGLYVAGKHAGHRAPDSDRYVGIDNRWVEVEVPHDLYSSLWNEENADLSPGHIQRAERYAREPGALPPGMAGFKGRHGNRKLFVSDGNHRAFASYLRGAAGARFYVPRKEWTKFLAAQ